MTIVIPHSVTLPIFVHSFVSVYFHYIFLVSWLSVSLTFFPLVNVSWICWNQVEENVSAATDVMEIPGKVFEPRMYLSEREKNDEKWKVQLINPHFKDTTRTILQWAFIVDSVPPGIIILTFIARRLQSLGMHSGVVIYLAWWNFSFNRIVSFACYCARLALTGRWPKDPELWI